MPFASEKQRRFMYARHPEIAKRWTAEEKRGNPVPRKKETSGARAIRESKARQAAYDAKVAKLEAGRRATAKRLAGTKATTQAQLRARKGTPKPLTHSQIAAQRREGVSRGLGFGSLLDVLVKPKKKKKD